MWCSRSRATSWSAWSGRWCRCSPRPSSKRSWLGSPSNDEGATPPHLWQCARPMTTTELAKAYDPKDVEPRWYAFWLEHDVFAASDDPNDGRPVYVLPMPPPNVTGSLHMGHALVCTIEDA